MEDPEFSVVLTGAAYSGPSALKAIRLVTGLSLWHSRQLLDSAPVTARAELPYGEAAAALRRLQQGGVQAALCCGYCERLLPTDGTPVDPGPCRSRYWPTAHCQANSETVCDLDRCPTHDPNWLRR
ncbi:ribosomal protein L7/L12 [Kitasatospora sp. NPDC057542]|uniref:ribosomal protein L7/L12 n=1 Tax=Kitasatospora sp. NPDC057542 TaxID=3346162 RepID=UPI00367818D6